MEEVSEKEAETRLSQETLVLAESFKFLVEKCIQQNKDVCVILCEEGFDGNNLGTNIMVSGNPANIALPLFELVMNTPELRDCFMKLMMRQATEFLTKSIGVPEDETVH